MMRNPNPFHTTLIAHRGADRPNLLVVSVLVPGSTNNVHSRVPNGCEYRADHEHSAAAHRTTKTEPVLAVVLGDGGAMRCSGTFVETKHVGGQSCSAQSHNLRKSSSGDTREDFSTSPLDTTIIDRQAEEMYFTKGVPTMGDHMHPMEGAILDFSVTRMRLIELFSRDGEICADERAALDLFDDAKRTVSDLHNLDRAVETYKKQYRHGITRYGRQKWNLAGLAVEPYDPDAA